MARTTGSWTGDELDLDGVEDIDGLADVAQAISPDAAAPILVAVEEDDEWLAIVRFDEDGDARVFVSDTRALTTSQVGAIFADAVAEEVADADPDDEEIVSADDDDADEESVAIDAAPAGDAGLLTDLGTTADQLLALCAQEGALPGDVTAAVCERAGCLDVYDSLRTT
jgi:putative tRNA adenosine deaminase-associated protein